MTCIIEGVRLFVCGMIFRFGYAVLLDQIRRLSLGSCKAEEFFNEFELREEFLPNYYMNFLKNIFFITDTKTKYYFLVIIIRGLIITGLGYSLFFIGVTSG